MSGETNFYDRLGISADADTDQIRKAYREAARRLHPDVNIEPGATELFLNIKEAYEILIDPDKRAAYDGTAALRKPTPPVRLSTIYSRSTIAHIKEPQLLYVLLDLEVLADPAAMEDTQENPPINISLILDCSTSMQGARMDMVKATSIDLVRQLRPRDVFSIVSFNDRPTVVVPAGSQHILQKLESSIRKLDTGGGTEIFKGLEAGFKEVRRYRNPSYTNHIILITDGHTYGDETKCLELADQAAALGIGISVLGIGTDWNDAFMDDLTIRTGGSSIYISKPNDIHKLLKKAFQELEKSYVERVNLDFRIVPGVHLRYAFRLIPDAGILGTKPPLNLGNIPQKSRQRVLLEFLVDPVGPEIENIIIAEGRITFDIPKYSESSYRIPITLLRPMSETPSVEPPPQVIVDAMSKLTLYRMQEKAHNELAEGKTEQAAQSLKNLATHLLSRGEQALAKTAIIEARNLEQRQKFSQDGEKEIKYGTRALLLPTGQKDENGNDSVP